MMINFFARTLVAFYLVFMYSLSNAETPEISLEERLESIESNIESLKSFVESRTPKAQTGDTYMPGWMLLSPDRQEQLWYKRYLKPDGSSVTGQVILSDLVSCDVGDTTCVLSYQVPEQLAVSNAKGYVLNIATYAFNHAQFTSVTCSGEEGDFATLPHFSGYGFMNYRDSGNTQPIGEYKSSVLYCPIVKDAVNDMVKIRFATNPGTIGSHVQSLKLGGGLTSIGTLVGYW